MQTSIHAPPRLVSGRLYGSRKNEAMCSPLASSRTWSTEAREWPCASQKYGRRIETAPSRGETPDGGDLEKTNVLMPNRRLAIRAHDIDAEDPLTQAEEAIEDVGERKVRAEFLLFELEELLRLTL